MHQHLHNESANKLKMNVLLPPPLTATSYQSNLAECGPRLMSYYQRVPNVQNLTETFHFLLPTFIIIFAIREGLR